MQVSPQEVYDLVLYQAGARSVRARRGSKLHHVKCHGALYNMSAMDEELSDAIARAVRISAAASALRAVEQPMMERGRKHGVTTVGEVFADRGYMDDGTLAPRGARRHDRGRRASVAQVLSMVEEAS